jgi:low temperature requirement protein LtrA
MSKEEERWSKERIRAEMEELERSARTRLSMAILLILIGIGCASTGFIFPLITPFAPKDGLLSMFAPFIVVGIILILIGLIPLKSWHGKRKRYKELKARL